MIDISKRKHIDPSSFLLSKEPIYKKEKQMYKEPQRSRY